MARMKALKLAMPVLLQKGFVTQRQKFEEQEKFEEKKFLVKDGNWSQEIIFLIMINQSFEIRRVLEGSLKYILTKPFLYSTNPSCLHYLKNSIQILELDKGPVFKFKIQSYYLQFGEKTLCAD